MSTQKTPQELLKSFKQYNKEAREKRAHKLGFTNAAAYIMWLEAQLPPDSLPKKKYKIPSGLSTKTGPVGKNIPPRPRPSSPPPPGMKGKTPTIHVVDILDKSGSMAGPKFASALYGINEGIKTLVEDKAKVHYTYTWCKFSTTISHPCIAVELKEIPRIFGTAEGGTALFDAIGETVSLMEKFVRDGDKVLVNIYTDGEENSSRKYNNTMISGIIENYSKAGWTFTFIGTEYDTKYVVENLNIHASNTLSYDGSAKGLANSMTANSVARSTYSSKVERGEDVSTGFYKDIN
jgi:uncharacterized protein YegL